MRGFDDAMRCFFSFNIGEGDLRHFVNHICLTGMCKTSSIDLSSVCRHFGAISVCIIIIIIWLGNQSQREFPPHPVFVRGGPLFLLLLLGWWLYHFIFVWSWNWIGCAGGGSAIFWYLALALLLLCGSGQSREFSTYPNDTHRKQATKGGRKNASKRGGGEEKYKSRWRPTERT